MLIKYFRVVFTLKSGIFSSVFGINLTRMLNPVNNRHEEMKKRRFLLEILVNVAVKLPFIGPLWKTLLITWTAQVSHIQPENTFSK